MLDAAQGKLAGYRWSSFPLYLDSSGRPDWLATDRVLGGLGVEDGRKGLAWYLRKNSTVGRAWIAERRVMENESRITKLVQTVGKNHR